jgi:hypothetical protein
MPVKRRRAKARNATITDEAIQAFELCEEIAAAGLAEAWEDDGGRRDEYLTAHLSLHGELSLRSWEASPADVPDSGACPWEGNLYAASWPKAQELRRELLTAIKRRR